MMEEWRTTTVCDRYEVSNLGRVRHKGGEFKRVRRGRISTFSKQTSLLKPYPTRLGYLMVKLGGVRTMSVHRLVALAFLPPPKSGEEVNHIDADKTNNTLPNLEWLSKSRNIKHSFKTGRNVTRGSRIGLSKLKEHEVRDIKLHLLNPYHGITVDLAKKYKVCRTLIGQIKNNKIWKHII
jgi:hypothetical protein